MCKSHGHQFLHLAPQRRILIDGLSAVCLTYCVDQGTNKIPNSPAQRHVTQDQVSLVPYSSTSLPGASLPPPSIPTHPGSSSLVDSRSEGSLVNHARRRTSFEQHPTMTADYLDAT